MKRVLKKVTAALLAATMVVGLAACGSGNGGSGNKSSKSGKVKIGVSIIYQIRIAYRTTKSCRTAVYIFNVRRSSKSSCDLRTQ